MATVNVTVPADTVTLVTSAADFIAENPSSCNVQVLFAASTPTYGAINWHTVTPGWSIARNNVAGDLYAYSTEAVTLVVSES
ncbi:MAG: hypothetical protein ACPGF7_09520 [Pontibacterium sp.]